MHCDSHKKPVHEITAMRWMRLRDARIQHERGHNRRRPINWRATALSCPRPCGRTEMRTHQCNPALGARRHISCMRARARALVESGASGTGHTHERKRRRFFVSIGYRTVAVLSADRGYYIYRQSVQVIVHLYVSVCVTLCIDGQASFHGD